jgi:hypothetical protein
VSTALAIKCMRRLLEDPVIVNTFRVMIDLRDALDVMKRADPVLIEWLLRLSSESIREALHKHELHITNAIIASKNRILRASGVEVPEGHEPIDANKYGSYTW